MRATTHRQIASRRRTKRAEQKLERGLAPTGRVERRIATALDFADMQRELRHFN